MKPHLQEKIYQISACKEAVYTLETVKKINGQYTALKMNVSLIVCSKT